jgi:hypothetical protein
MSTLSARISGLSRPWINFGARLGRAGAASTSLVVLLSLGLRRRPLLHGGGRNFSAVRGGMIAGVHARIVAVDCRREGKQETWRRGEVEVKCNGNAGT